jgi:hypothetical protein
VGTPRFSGSATQLQCCRRPLPFKLKSSSQNERLEESRRGRSSRNLAAFSERLRNSGHCFVDCHSDVLTGRVDSRYSPALSLISIAQIVLFSSAARPDA